MAENKGQEGAATDPTESDVESSASQISELRTMPNDAVLEAMARSVSDTSQVPAGAALKRLAPLPPIPKMKVEATESRDTAFPLRPTSEGTVRPGMLLPDLLARATYVDDEVVEATAADPLVETSSGKEATGIPTHVGSVAATQVGGDETAVEKTLAGSDEQGGDQPGIAHPGVTQQLEEGGSGDVTNIVAGIPEIQEARAKLFKGSHGSADTLPAWSAMPASETADDGSRGFPLPAPAHEELEDEHTDVETGPPSVGFRPGEHGLGPGFSLIEATVPAAGMSSRRPLPGVQGIEAAAPKLSSLVKSVSVPDAWDPVSAQEVQAQRHLPPEEVPLALRLGGLTGLIGLGSKRRFLVVGVLTLVGGVVVAALVSGGGTNTARNQTASLPMVAPQTLPPPLPVVIEQPALIVDEEEEDSDDLDAEAQGNPILEDEHSGDAAGVSNTASAKALAKRGRTLFKKGKNVPALRLFKEAIAADPEYAVAQRDLGQLYQRRGNWDLAVASYRKYLQLAPKAKDAQKVRKTIRRLRRR